MFRYLVLGLLRRGGARHGYAMMKEYRERAGIQVSTGNFYRELQRLMAEGLVRTAAKPPGADARRAPYEITAAGAAAFDTWLRDAVGGSGGSHDDGLAARAVFLAEAPASAVGPALDRWQEELWLRGKNFERMREVALAASSGADGRSFRPLSLLLARRLKHVAADLEFLEELRTAYLEWAARRPAGDPPVPAPADGRRRVGGSTRDATR